MQKAYDTVKKYFDALLNRDAETLTSLMLPRTYYVKIGTDSDEVIEGAEDITAYYKNHAESTEDFSITFHKFDVQERNDVAWFYTKQIWKLKWQGVPEEFVMRMTGVLEMVDNTWLFAQIHASIGVPTQ